LISHIGLYKLHWAFIQCCGLTYYLGMYVVALITKSLELIIYYYT